MYDNRYKTYTNFVKAAFVSQNAMQHGGHAKMLI
jgi:hypothetical protein